MSVDPGAFSRYVAALPASWEPSLVTGDTVSTAFYEALKAGWSEEQLQGDGMTSLLSKRASDPVGLLVSRLRGLAQSRPAPARDSAARPRGTFVSRPRTYLSPAMAAERMAYVFDLPGSGLTPDEAEAGMRSIIAEQKART